MKTDIYKRLRLACSYLLLFALIMFAGCHKQDSTPAPAPPTPVVDTDSTQYGTPFTGVPDPRDAVIYQVNMRCFSASRDFSGVINRLDNIKALGVNVIYLMPIFPVGTLRSVNSPYCVQNYKAVGNEFGSLTDLRNLVDGAHSRGMAVIIDWVANHTSWDNAWITEHPSWYEQNANGTILSPSGYSDVAQLNYDNQDMRSAMISAMKYWVYKANIDGFRCDFADNIPADFWVQATTALKAITPTHKLLMLAEGTRSSNYSSGFDYNFGFNFYGLLKSIYSNNLTVQSINNLNTTEYNGAISDQNQIVRYLTNHDVNSSDGTPLDLFGGIKGSMAAFVVVAYMKSVPFIYNGQEVATPVRMTFPFTSTTIDWTINPSVTAEYTKVIMFRDSSAAIRRGVLDTYSNADICAFTKSLDSDTVAVFVNLRNASKNITLPSVLANTTWNDAYTNSSVTLSTSLTLQPYSYLVLKNY